MNYLGQNDNLFQLLKTDLSILSSQITGISIYLKDFTLIIDVDFKLRSALGGYMKLKFSDIREYAFYHSSEYTFYNVEIFKLLRKGNMFYISFDPDDGDLSSISKNDNDLIVCGSIDGYRY